MKSGALLFTTLHLRIAHGIESEARPVRLGAETSFLCPTDFTDLHRFSGKRLRVKSGEEWRKLFTRASFKVTDVYVLPVKSEECF